MFKAIKATAAAAAILLASAGATAMAGPDSAESIITIYRGELTDAETSAKAETLLKRAHERGQVRVIVGLDAAIADEDEITPADQRRQVNALRRLQTAVAARSMIPAGQVKNFETIPYMSAFVTAAQLERLLRDPEVTSVQEDVPLRPTLQDSVPLINANKVWKQEGFTGNGIVVAVLDTGAEYSHPMLKGKVVEGFCRSSNGPEIFSLCPKGVTSSDKMGSGKNCTGIGSCFHGTHVSSIAVGSSSTLKGVARRASLISGLVFSRFENPSDCAPSPAPCVLAFFSDIIAGLERVYELRDTHDIASVNISIGGGIHSTACDALLPALADIINKLFKKKIATVISSGNDGSDFGISAPACIKKAIAVGSTNKDDSVSSFSNHHALVDVMAPGGSINAAVPGGGFGIASGTSMAAPHIAGVIALLKDARINAKVNEILKALKQGEKVERAGVKKTRTDALEAVQFLESLVPATTADAMPD